MFPQVFEPFNCNVGVELFSHFNDFVGYLPNLCSNVVSLFSAEVLEFEPCLAGESDEEAEASLHNDACYPPAFFEVFLKPLVGAVPAYWKPYSLHSS